MVPWGWWCEEAPDRVTGIGFDREGDVLAMVIARLDGEMDVMTVGVAVREVVGLIAIGWDAGVAAGGEDEEAAIRLGSEE